jgi:hypothetical protein
MTESVNFVLKTTSINTDHTAATYYNTTFSNNIGTVAQNRTSITWNNINLKNLLGEMYDRYERFNISLNFISGSRTGSANETVADGRMFYVRMRGLNFTSSYDQKTGNNDNSAVFATLSLPLSAFTPWNFSTLTPIYFTFRKQETTNINIDLVWLFSDGYYTPASNNAMIGHFIIGFNIIGCDDYKNNKKSENQNVDLELRKIF